MISSFLFALMFNFVPELAAWRRWYEAFWFFVALLAIAGLLSAWVLSRRVPRSRSWTALPVIAILGVVGAIAGWGVWQSGWLWHWGTDERQMAEVGSCILAGAAWAIVGGQLCFHAKGSVADESKPSA